MSDIHHKADDLMRYYTELVRRLTQVGVRDVGELLTLFEQLRLALEMVSRQEIAWAAERAHELVDALVRMDANLQALRNLKAALNQVPDHPA